MIELSNPPDSEIKFDFILLGMGEDGNLHSEIGDYYDYVNTIRDIELITN